ncbi:HlyD family secretion protein [Variovorax sp. PBL-E5]|uniref:HlyD family secretion protein n=1 Tax=Variovorax sp. PBL-E5 TaxID=434014 RepID=UPI0018D9BF9E|nr:HlyD family secretion protein [Variovorax sp. PBL-E5]
MDASEEAARDTPPPPARDRRRRMRMVLMLLGPVVVVVLALGFYLSGGRYESTDDAYVQAARVAISANVAGRVVELDVHDNQAVRQGDVLFRLDDAPFRIAVDEAAAQLAAARLQIESLKANYRQRQSELASAQDTVAFQQREFQRQQRLIASGIASQLQLDRASHSLDEARAQVAGVRQQIGAVVANLGGNPAIAPERHPLVQEAQARLDKARLNLSYTVVKAPGDGVVTRVEQLQVGSYINAAAPVFALVSTGDIWVEANFKEDQLTHMHAGQKVSVEVDSYPGRTFAGTVASVSPGTGSQFSVLPPENATGNWVKVVQRLPIRVELEHPDPAFALHAGLSATVSVDTGRRRRLFGGAEAEPGSASASSP